MSFISDRDYRVKLSVSSLSSNYITHIIHMCVSVSFIHGVRDHTRNDYAADV